MRQFSDKEIALCRQIAEIYKKPIEYGDYFIWASGKPLVRIHDDIPPEKQKMGIIPIWQEHDCLDWIGKEGYKLGLWKKVNSGYCEVLWDREIITQTDGNTPLEALLKTVLEIMRQGK